MGEQSWPREGIFFQFPASHLPQLDGYEDICAAVEHRLNGGAGIEVRCRLLRVCCGDPGYMAVPGSRVDYSPHFFFSAAR